MARGSLTVVGTGITIGLHLTPQTREAIESADEFMHLAGDPLADEWMSGLHPNATSLRAQYRAGERREAIYERIVDAILAPVRAGKLVCAAFYGHAGVFVRPSHEAIRRARSEGFAARMLPAVSAEDCLFADLGVDPADGGWRSYDATDFLVHARPVDTATGLLLWQITVIGDPNAVSQPRLDNLRVLADRLLEHYPAAHEVVLYEATPFPIGEPLIERVPLGELAASSLGSLSTLYVPPATSPVVDIEMVARLGLSTD